MRAIVHHRYGSPDDVLELKDIDKPVVNDDEVLVRVHAASVHPDVWHVVKGLPYVLRLVGAGLLKPKNSVPGTDEAGYVESVGKNVTRFQPGDEVFGESVRGHQWHNGGAYAEYVSVPEDALALKPDNITFEQAAAVPTSGLIALQNLPNEGWMHPGQKSVLVNGAGGGVGALALQLAIAYGADVTGVDNTTKLEMVRWLGADRVIDYTQEDFTHRRRALRSDLRYSREPSVFGLSMRPHPRGDPHAHWTRPIRGCGRTLVGKPALRFQTGRALPIRESIARFELFDVEQERLNGCPETVPRSRESRRSSTGRTR